MTNQTYLLLSNHTPLLLSQPDDVCDCPTQKECVSPNTYLLVAITLTLALVLSYLVWSVLIFWEKYTFLVNEYPRMDGLVLFNSSVLMAIFYSAIYTGMAIQQLLVRLQGIHYDFIIKLDIGGGDINFGYTYYNLYYF